MEIHVINEKPSIVNQYLAQLRDVNIQQDRLRFRTNLTRIGEIMAYEISRTLDFHEVRRESPLSEFSSTELSSPPYLLCILRASLPFFQGFLNIFDDSDSGFAGAYRRHSVSDEFDISLDYLASDRLEDKNVIIADPMLATGRSLVDTINQLLKRGNPKCIHIASVIAAKPGMDHLMNELGHLKLRLWTAALDEVLNEKYYIVPGLGDAGDLAFGQKL